MTRLLFGSAIAALMLAAAPAAAITVTDPTGDFLPGFIGPNNPDLDVTSFSVNYNPTSQAFLLGATFAGVVNPATVGFYVIGVNTGAATNAPFASIGQPNVIFNQTIRVNKDGTGTPASGTFVIAGNTFSALIPLSALPSTGFTPDQYGFNLWPRVATGNNNQISDFAPNNANLSITPVPEPASWAMLLVGFLASGMALRTPRLRRTIA